MLSGKVGEVSSPVGHWTLFRLVIDRENTDGLGIVADTRSAQDWRGFPSDAVAIGFNDLGDYILLLPQGRKHRLADVVFWWDHETCRLDVLADSIEELAGVPAEDSDDWAIEDTPG